MLDEMSWYSRQDWSLDAEWYEVTNGSTLRQCDILFGCPVFRLGGSMHWPIEPSESLPIRIEKYDSIILTQSCDLENNKVEDILLAQIIAWPAAVRQELARGNQIVNKRDYRKALIEGNTPGQALLHKHEGEPRLDWSIVSFQRLYTIQKDFLVEYAHKCGDRLRLRSPYREHIAQAFARFVMRVGLPYNARSFEREGQVTA
ncbi:MAG: hypothetical protein ACP5XB_00310 [Isosphaeraceae bacterium]